MTAQEQAEWDAFISQLHAAHRDFVAAITKAGVIPESLRNNGVEFRGQGAKDLAKRAEAWFTAWSKKNDAGRLSAFVNEDYAELGEYSVRFMTRGSRKGDVSRVPARRVRRAA